MSKVDGGPAMGASGGSEMLNCMVKHYEPFIGYKEANITVSDLRTMKAEVDDRIAELTAEVARLRDLVKEAYEEGANDGYDEAVSGERGHGDRHAEWEASEAYKGVVRLEFPECSGDAISCPENEGYGCCIARNAMKEGL